MYGMGASVLVHSIIVLAALAAVINLMLEDKADATDTTGKTKNQCQRRTQGLDHSMSQFITLPQHAGMI